MTERLSALDASFLEVETPRAHMHVGWAAGFDPPAGRARPGFEELRAHIGERLARAPRYRQRLARVPLSLADPVWVDDQEFDLAHHVRRAPERRLGAAVDRVMSQPLDPERPLWEIWIADRLPDGRLGIVGKAHHCMVDGVAAVELASLLVDPEPEPAPAAADGWTPARAPSAIELLAGAGLDGALGAARTGLAIAGMAARTIARPGRLRAAPAAAESLTRTLLRAARPAPGGPLNRRISSTRHLAWTRRPLEELRLIRRVHGSTINDVVLAAAAGGLRNWLDARGERRGALKTMVPVSVRGEGEELGNRISFVFVDLPCDVVDPSERIGKVRCEMARRKGEGDPAAADEVLGLVAASPRPLRSRIARMAASPRAFNLVVSNIPGPRDTLYMRGCRLREAYPIVPLAEGHGVSIGMTSVGDEACFGVYADRQSVPDADLIAEGIAAELDALATRSAAGVAAGMLTRA